MTTSFIMIVYSDWKPSALICQVHNINLVNLHVNLVNLLVNLVEFLVNLVDLANQYI